jgi:hypothetical protein
MEIDPEQKCGTTPYPDAGGSIRASVASRQIRRDPLRGPIRRAAALHHDGRHRP